MKNRYYPFLVPFCCTLFICFGFTRAIRDNNNILLIDSTLVDSAHYWVLKPLLDPQSEEVRIEPGNYVDMGMIDPPSGNDPCNTGYVELCGIYVIPDPVNKKLPYFRKSDNDEIYYSLKRNRYLEGKVFYKDL